MKFKILKVGNFFFPIKDINKKFEIIDTINVSLSRKDFENYQGKWKDFFSKLKKDKLKINDLSLFFFYLPKILWEKVKKEKILKNYKCNWLCISNIFYYSKLKKFDIILDILK